MTNFTINSSNKLLSYNDVDGRTHQIVIDKIEGFGPSHGNILEIRTISKKYDVIFTDSDTRDTALSQLVVLYA